MVWKIVTLALWILAAILLASPQKQANAAQSQTVKVEVEQVLVNASVTDDQDRVVTDLDQENFHVWEDKIEQKITYFSTEEQPLSAGIIFDISGSMEDKISQAKDAVLTFLKSGNVEDEYFLIEFSDRPQFIQSFTRDIVRLEKHLGIANPMGTTALFDAVYLGLKKVQEGTNPKKALFLVTDGDDNSSRYSLSDLRDFAREQDVQLYSIVILSGISSFGYSLGVRPRIASVAELTGGRAFFPRSVHDLKDICAKIAAEMKSEYVIGYRPSNPAKDGGWRKLQVKIDPQKEGLRLSVRAKSGYYAASR